tara:strand:- start:760 stop:1020 length:261 start_codon:yes stop_codon:yes gene_type:complete
MTMTFKPKELRIKASGGLNHLSLTTDLLDYFWSNNLEGIIKLLNKAQREQPIERCFHQLDQRGRIGGLYDLKLGYIESTTATTPTN